MSEPENERRRLARFQERLLDLLDEDLPPEEVRRRLAAEPEFAGYVDYIQDMEPRMIGVAQQLVRKWGLRREAEDAE